MKKIAAFLIVFFILSIQIAVSAVELTAGDNSGGRVSLFSDVLSDKKSKGDITSVVGNININESVDGNITAVIGNINEVKGTSGELIAVFGNVNVDGNVNGDVITVMGNTTINGKVSGQIITVLGKLKLTDNAEVGNGIVSIGGTENSNKAKIYGEQDIVGLGFLQDARAALSILNMFFSIFILAVGLIVIRVTKKRFENISIGIENNLLRKTIWGVGSLIGITILLPILSVTVIAPVIYFILMILAGMVTSILLGRFILRVFNSYPNIYLEFTTGLILLSVIKVILIFVAFQNGINLLVFGGLILAYSIMIYSIGIGILLDSKFGAVAIKNSNSK